MSTPSVTPSGPRGWCRRILAALRYRQSSGRAGSNLEMLLTYFIERDPTLQQFADLLAQYIASSRPGVAEAASVLQRAWQRGAGATADTALPACEETLRTLGARLDELGAQAAYLVLTPEAVQVQPFGEAGLERLGPVELWQEVAARTALRGQLASDSPATPRYEPLLRLVGAEMDAQPAQSYQLLVTPQTVVIEGSAGYYRLCSAEVLATRVQEAVAQRGTAPQAPGSAQ